MLLLRPLLNLSLMLSAQLRALTLMRPPSPASSTMCFDGIFLLLRVLWHVALLICRRHDIWPNARSDDVVLDSQRLQHSD